MDLIYMMLHVCIHLLDCTFALELLSHVRTYTGAIFFFLLPLNSHEWWQISYVIIYFLLRDHNGRRTVDSMQQS
jgi:hypothetical protein